jgi:hypothetical protein
MQVWSKLKINIIRGIEIVEFVANGNFFAK